MSKQVVISGTGLYTPPNIITNEELVESFNQYVESYNTENKDKISSGELTELAPSSAAFIEKASGIQQRFVTDKAGILDPKIMHPMIPERSNEEKSVTCEMAVNAAKVALEQANLSAQDIGAVFVACSNMQRPYPSVSVELQNALGIKAYGFDMSVACSSASFGIQTAYDAIQCGHAKHVLMVNPELCTAQVNFRDRESHFIFGDACTAAILSDKDHIKSKDCYEIINTKLITQFSNNIRCNFGYLNRLAPEHEHAPDKLFTQQGRKVFKEVVPLVVELIGSHLAEFKLNPHDVKKFWLHQANINMNQLIAKKLLGTDAPAEMTPSALAQYANTSSAGTLISFHLYRDDLAVGDYGVICSFGAGYSAGSIIVQKCC